MINEIEIQTIMKKLFLIVAALFVAVSFSSCDKDEDKDVSIVGSWQLVSVASYDEYSGWEEWYADIFLVLESNGQGTTNWGGYARIKYLFVGEKLTFIYVDEDYLTESWDVAKLSSTELILAWQDTESEKKQILTFNRK